MFKINKNGFIVIKGKMMKFINLSDKVVLVFLDIDDVGDEG